MPGISFNASMSKPSLSSLTKTAATCDAATAATASDVQRPERSLMCVLKIKTRALGLVLKVKTRYVHVEGLLH